MRASLRPVVISLLLVGGFAFVSTAQTTIPIQGNVTNSGGMPVDTTISMLFKLYNGGIVVWSETHPAVSVVEGVYAVQLGSITPIDTVSFWTNLQLGITLGGDPELTPRTIIGTSPTSISLINLRVREVEGEKGTSVNLIGGFGQNSDSAGVEAATISGGGLFGMPNKVNADGGTIGGGWDNIAEGETATISGGEGHRATGPLSTIGGGMTNTAAAEKSTVAGGESNAATGGFSTVTGGFDNTASASKSTVGGGEANTAIADWTTVAGGFSNDATQSYAAVSGGRLNVASGGRSFVGGGEDNQSSGYGAVILGGFHNRGSGEATTIGGGEDNHATAQYSMVAGGYHNQATGLASTVVGGQLNAARGTLSFAAGYNAKALHDGGFVWGDNTGLPADSFVTTANNQFLIRANGGVGIGDSNPFAPLHVTKHNIGVSEDDVFNAVIIAEDADATIGVYSNPGGTWGSAINLVEMTSCGVLPCAPLPDFENMWSIARTTTGGGNDLYFRFGTDTSYAVNPGKMVLSDTGDLLIVGALSKGSGSFKIDHPLDPENKYLYHSFVESPDMMNVYNGNVFLDEGGEATIELPSYFEALNRDFRYQLTAVGAPGPNLYIASKIDGNRFSIAGGSPGMEVSWQVTGIRRDPYAVMHPIIPEVAKPEAERGTYLHPGAYGRTATESLVISH